MFRFHVSFICHFFIQCAPKGLAEQPTHPFLVAWSAYNLMIALPALPLTILFQFEQTLHFCQFPLYIFEIEHFWTCFLYHVSFICHFSISVCYKLTKGSAERSTYTFLVARVAHNLLIALPASPPTILFQFEHTVAFQPVHLFTYTHFLVWICLNMFRFWASSICLFSILVCPHRLSRAIRKHIFSCLVGAQFADCITCLATNHFVSIWADNCLSASSLALYIQTFF